MSPTVVGMDVGGTSTRTLVADLDGRVVGSGTAGGGNPTTHGVPAAMAEIRASLEQALRGVDGVEVDRDEVLGNVIGAAGFVGSVAREALDGVWRGLGLPGPPVVVGDVEVAFASGTDATDGSVLISGTGAVAASVVDGRTDVVADGIGWLLGDRGSGFWIGREAISASLAVPRDPDDDLAEVVADALSVVLTGDRATDRHALLQAAYAASRSAISGLAPVVVDAAAAGSAGATAILDSAAEELVRTLSSVRAPAKRSVVVLGGSVLTRTRLRDDVTARIARTWPCAPVRTAGSGAGGAAWIAARATGRPLPAALHSLLTGTRPDGDRPT